MIECVPNFSEGRDLPVVRAIEAALTVPLLHSTSDADHNRTVLTFAGDRDAVEQAAFRAIEKAVELIDIRRHEGVHPRTGAADVVPFIPLSGSTLVECAEAARHFGKRVWGELRVPVYFYEAAAVREQCVRLENVRRLASTLPPDVGDGVHPTAGVCIIGARKFLIAWNINLRTTDVRVAREIASAIRESNGGFPAVKALGLALPERGQVQVSMNLVDFERTALHTVFDRVRELCRARGVEIEGSELIGMIPRAALDGSRGHDLRWLNFHPGGILENMIV